MNTASFSETFYQSHSSPVPAAPFKKCLEGSKAFYQQPDYMQVTRQELAQAYPLPVHYTWNTESKVTRIARQIFTILILPIGIYKFLHRCAGLFIVPASVPRIIEYSLAQVNTLRSQVSLTGPWKFKRLTIQVDGYKIDAMIVGKASTLNNGRWALASLGNAEFYEGKLFDKSFTEILNELESNALVFNYPGVGTSTGLPNRTAMAKAYCAMLSFLEDHEQGIGAKEIIGYAYSIGGGVQSDALKKHCLKKEIKYVFVKNQTFSSLYKTATALTIKPLAFLVKALGWNMKPAEVSKSLQAPEIILQTATVTQYEEITDSSKIRHDNVIAAEASLAKALLDDSSVCQKNKVFIGIPDNHTDGLSNPKFLANKIESLLKTSSSD